jgi:multiple sugar transport system ATP-binding protein
VTEKLRELARELDSESMRTQLVVSLDSASRIKEGEPAELWVDPSRMHLFDPATGENLTRGLVGVEALA